MPYQNGSRITVTYIDGISPPIPSFATFSACYRKIVTPVDPYRRRSSRPDYPATSDGRKLALNRATVNRTFPFLFRGLTQMEGE